MSSTRQSFRSLGGTRAAQRGVVLVVALIFLLLLTIIAVAASGRSLLQERMAGALLNGQRAEMSAQTALRGAEWALFSSATVGSAFVCTAASACYRYDPLFPNAVVVNFRTNPGWVTPGSLEYLGLNGTIDFTATAGKLAANPRYILEDMGPVAPPDSGPQHESGQTGPGGGGPGRGGESEMYRITARATGGNNNTVAVLESTFDAHP